jgi:hypothetical protein
VYDELEDQRISSENDVRVIEQYIESDDFKWYYYHCGNCLDSQLCYESNTEQGEEIKNDIRVMLEYDDDLLLLYYWNLYFKHRSGFTFMQYLRLHKINKIKRIMTGKIPTLGSNTALRVA